MPVRSKSLRVGDLVQFSARSFVSWNDTVVGIFLSRRNRRIKRYADYVVMCLDGTVIRLEGYYYYPFKILSKFSDVE